MNYIQKAFEYLFGASDASKPVAPATPSTRASFYERPVTRGTCDCHLCSPVTWGIGTVQPPTPWSFPCTPEPQRHTPPSTQWPKPLLPYAKNDRITGKPHSKAPPRSSVYQDTIDLHGCYAKDAELKVSSYIAQANGRPLTIITGRGRHSKNGAVLKPLVERIVRMKGLRFEWVNEGKMVVNPRK